MNISLATEIDINDWSVRLAIEKKKPYSLKHTPNELHCIGLPDTGTNHYKATFDLAKMRPCSAEEYAYSTALPEAADAKHGMWTFIHDDMRVVLPALALIRALVGNFPICYNKLFHPQSLEDLCDYAPTNSSEQIQVSNTIGPTRTIDRVELRRRLTWFACFPSARRSWGSIYRHALTGRLDIDAPQALVNGWFRGNRHKNTFYTTKLQIQNIIASEQPYEFAKQCSKEIEFIGNNRRIMHSTKVQQHLDIPRRGTESSLSDEEWARVRQLFSKDPTQEISRRELLDAILLKWTDSLTWKSLEKKLGKNEGTTSAAYYRWRIDGRFDLLLEILKEMRANSFNTAQAIKSNPLPV